MKILANPQSHNSDRDLFLDAIKEHLRNPKNSLGTIPPDILYSLFFLGRALHRHAVLQQERRQRER